MTKAQRTSSPGSKGVWQLGDQGGQEWAGPSLSIPTEQGLGPVTEGPGHSQPTPRGAQARGTRPLVVAAGAGGQHAAGVCVGGSKEGQREEAGFLKPPQPSKTDQQTDRQLARGSLGGHSCFSKYLNGGRRGPVVQGGV